MNVTSPDTTRAFSRLVELQQLFAEADSRLDAVQAACDARLAKVLEGVRDDYVAAKVVRDQAEAEIRELAKAHPEWLVGRSIKTPFGEIQFRDSSKLDVPNPEATVVLIQALHSAAGQVPHASQLVRVERVPNLEALEVLSDEDLAALAVKRVRSQSVSVKRAKVDVARSRKSKPVADATAAAPMDGRVE